MSFLRLRQPLRYYNFLLLFIFLMPATGLKSQVKSGYRFGINLTTMKIQKNGIDVRAETPVGIQFGLMYEMPLSQILALQSGFLLSSKGTDYKIDNTDYSIAPAYFEIPLHAVYYFGRRSIRASVFGGPYFSTAFGGYKIESDGLKDLTFGRKYDKDLKYLDFGIDLGASFNIKGFLISFQYGAGLRNVSPHSNMIMKNRVIGISIGTLLKKEH